MICRLPGERQDTGVACCAGRAGVLVSAYRRRDLSSGWLLRGANFIEDDGGHSTRTVLYCFKSVKLCGWDACPVVQNFERQDAMNIVVCMKQVPASTRVEIDEQTGNLKRLGAAGRTNPFDLYALECALKIRERLGGTVTVLTMGPRQAESMIRDAYLMGADDAVILSDPQFAGADVLATSYTLSQGIQLLGGTDLIICGRQTTDGDTAQIGPALAEHLHLPHAAWVHEITGVDETGIRVRQDLSGFYQISEMKFPCLITVDKDLCVPRLPSYRRKAEAADKPIRTVSLADLPKPDLSRIGLEGSATTVERVFPPPAGGGSVTLEGTAAEKADQLFDLLAAAKYF